ncbi:hypothetical protein DQ04_17641020, partial [Trypanosoma grayi]|uniref:hypothetical protein n=1 Tax=Trypanosoma grayi TaxID=71804 RepID=UPI0004F49BA2
RRVELRAAAIAEAADALLQLVLPPSSPVAVADRDVVTQLWECFAVNIRCPFLFPDDAVKGAAEPPDYSVGPMTGSSGISPTQAAIETALQRLGWGGPLRP